MVGLALAPDPLAVALARAVLVGVTTRPVVSGPVVERVKLWVTKVVLRAREMAVPLAERPRVVVKAVAATEVRVVFVGTMRTERVVVVVAAESVEEEEPMVVVTMAGAVVLMVTVVVAVPVGDAEGEEAVEEEPPLSLNWPE